MTLVIYHWSSLCDSDSLLFGEGTQKVFTEVSLFTIDCNIFNEVELSFTYPFHIFRHFRYCHCAQIDKVLIVSVEKAIRNLVVWDIKNMSCDLNTFMDDK